MRWLTLIFSVVFVFSACSSIRTFSDYNEAIDFDQYRTYSWSAEEDPFNEAYPQYDNSLNRMRIREAIDAAMQERGYILQNEADETDLQVDFHIHLEQRSVPYHGDETDEIGLGAARITGIYQYNEGMLIIHWVDLERGEVVWQGIAGKVLDISQIDKAESTIQKGVQKVFARLPR